MPSTEMRNPASGIGNFFFLVGRGGKGKMSFFLYMSIKDPVEVLSWHIFEVW